MTEDQARENLIHYLKEELSPQERRQLEERLNTSLFLREELEDLRKLLALVRRGGIEPSAEFGAKLTAKLAQAKASLAPAPPRPAASSRFSSISRRYRRHEAVSLFLRWRWTAMAAALVLTTLGLTAFVKMPTIQGRPFRVAVGPEALPEFRPQVNPDRYEVHDSEVSRDGRIVVRGVIADGDLRVVPSSQHGGQCLEAFTTRQWRRLLAKGSEAPQRTRRELQRLERCAELFQVVGGSLRLSERLMAGVLGDPLTVTIVEVGEDRKDPDLYLLWNKRRWEDYRDSYYQASLLARVGDSRPPKREEEGGLRPLHLLSIRRGGGDWRACLPRWGGRQGGGAVFSLGRSGGCCLSPLFAPGTPACAMPGTADKPLDALG